MRLMAALCVWLFAVPAWAQNSRPMVFVFPVWADQDQYPIPNPWLADPHAYAQARFEEAKTHYDMQAYGRFVFMALTNYGYVPVTTTRASITNCSQLPAVRTQIRNTLLAQYGSLPSQAVWVFMWPSGDPSIDVPCNPHASGADANLTRGGIGFLHEVGHTLSLSHDNSLELLGTTYTHVQYGDPFSIMAVSGGHISPGAKIFRGWIGPTTPQRYAVAPDGPAPHSEALQPYENTTAGVSVLIVPTAVQADGFASGYKRTYYVAHRRDGGHQVTVNRGVSYPGLYPTFASIQQGGNGTPMGVIDHDPSAERRFLLTTGDRFVDAQAGLTITVISTGPVGATVQTTWESSGAPEPASNLRAL